MENETKKQREARINLIREIKSLKVKEWIGQITRQEINRLKYLEDILNG